MNSLNSEKLKSAIKSSGIKMTVVSSLIGISRESLYNKVERKTEFTASEIAKLSSVLGLSTETRDEIFFGN